MTCIMSYHILDGDILCKIYATCQVTKTGTFKKQICVLLILLFFASIDFVSISNGKSFHPIGCCPVLSHLYLDILATMNSMSKPIEMGKERKAEEERGRTKIGERVQEMKRKKEEESGRERKREGQRERA